jgi:hypothetical protein
MEKRNVRNIKHMDMFASRTRKELTEDALGATVRDAGAAFSCYEFSEISIGSRKNSDEELTGQTSDAPRTCEPSTEPHLCELRAAH